MVRTADTGIVMVKWICGGQRILIRQEGYVALRPGEVVQQDTISGGLLVCCDGT